MTEAPATCTTCQYWKSDQKPSRDIGVQYTEFRRCPFIQHRQLSGLATWFQDRTWTHPDATCADYRRIP